MIDHSINPSTEIRTGTPMINFPNIDFSKFSEPFRDLPKFDLPKFDAANFSPVNIDLTKLDPRNITNFDMPSAINQVAETGKILSHVAIGAAIVTAQSTIEIGREIADQIEIRVRKLAEIVA
jgi:hypothetical protein